MVKGWIDATIDHQMVLRRDDPLVAPLQALGEPIFLVDSNPTVEHIAKVIFDHASGAGLSGRARHGLGNADVFRELYRGAGRRTARGPRLTAQASFGQWLLPDAMLKGRTSLHWPLTRGIPKSEPDQSWFRIPHALLRI